MYMYMYVYMYMHIIYIYIYAYICNIIYTFFDVFPFYCQWKTMTFAFSPKFSTPISDPRYSFPAFFQRFRRSKRRNRSRWYSKPGTLRDRRCTIAWRTSSSPRQVNCESWMGGNLGVSCSLCYNNNNNTTTTTTTNNNNNNNKKKKKNKNETIWRIQHDKNPCRWFQRASADETLGKSIRFFRWLDLTETARQLEVSTSWWSTSAAGWKPPPCPPPCAPMACRWSSLSRGQGGVGPEGA